MNEQNWIMAFHSQESRDNLKFKKEQCIFFWEGESIMFTDTNAFSLFSRISDMVFCSLTLLKRLQTGGGVGTYTYKTIMENNTSNKNTKKKEKEKLISMNFCIF